jgi:hypothetical protein
MRLEGLGKLKKNSTSFGTLTGDLPACSIVPQPTTLPRAPLVTLWNIIISQNFEITPINFTLFATLKPKHSSEIWIFTKRNPMD